MDKINFDFEPFGEQLVGLYQNNHLEDQVSPQVAGTLDKTVAQWNQAPVPTFDSVSALAAYEVRRRTDLGSSLRADLGSVTSQEFINYATRQIDLGVQKATVQLAFQYYLREFMFDAQGQPTEKAKELMEGQEESEGFRKSVATAYHHFCRDFQLDEEFRNNTQRIVDTLQKSFMQSDLKHLLARAKYTGIQAALKEAGYKKNNFF